MKGIVSQVIYCIEKRVTERNWRQSHHTAEPGENTQYHPLTYSPKWEKYQDTCVSAGTHDLAVCHLPSEIVLQCHFAIFHIICDTVPKDRAGFCVSPEPEDLQVTSRIHSETTCVFKS